MRHAVAVALAGQRCRNFAPGRNPIAGNRRQLGRAGCEIRRGATRCAKDPEDLGPIAGGTHGRKRRGPELTPAPGTTVGDPPLTVQPTRERRLPGDQPGQRRRCRSSFRGETRAPQQAHRMPGRRTGTGACACTSVSTGVTSCGVASVATAPVARSCRRRTMTPRRSRRRTSGPATPSAGRSHNRPPSASTRTSVPSSGRVRRSRSQLSRAMEGEHPSSGAPAQPAGVRMSSPAGSPRVALIFAS